ncbi:MAG: M48 family metalloprotease [Thermodesulfobacteriota bacterium]
MFSRKVKNCGALFLLVLFVLWGSFVGKAGAMTIEEEKKLGKRIFLEIEKDVEFVKDPALQIFLDEMGRSLVAQVGATPFDFKFYLIKTSEPNAFAIPGGYIFVTTGLIVLAENEHELAGVLGHEIAHVTERHVDQIFERSKRLSIATVAAVIAGVLLGGGGKGSEAAATMAMATSEALVLKYTRDNERDADQNGLQYVVKAGYDPNGMITFLNKISKASLTSTPKIPAYLSTHPVTENRISLLENLIQIAGKPSGLFRSIRNFRKIQMRAFAEEREAHVSVTHFQSVVEGRPEDAEGYYGLGLAYRRMGRLDKAAEVLQKGTTIAPEDPDLFNELGIVYFLSGKLDLAIENLEVAKSLFREASDENLVGLYYLGRGYQEKGEMAKALPLLLRARKEMPEFSDVYYHLGLLHGRMNLRGLSHFYFGKYYQLRGEKNNALSQFRRATDLLEKGSPERDEAEREIKELTGGK